MKRYNEETGAPQGYCDKCGEFTQSRYESPEVSRCCDADMHQHAPEGWNLFLLKEDASGRLVKVLRDNYATKQEAVAAGECLKANCVWVKYYRVETCFTAAVATVKHMVRRAV